VKANPKKRDVRLVLIYLIHTRRANGTSMGNGTIPASKHP